MSTDPTLLIVDDEESILSAIERLFCDHDLQILKATSGKQALDLLRSEQVAVVLSDNHMPGMLGLEFLQRAKQVSPETSRVMMTAYADLQTAMTAINSCDIYRFVTKPWQEGEIEAAVEESLNRHRLLSAMRKGDEGVLLALAQAVELKDPYTRGHCERVGELAMALGRQLGFDGERIDELKKGAWLHDCGKIGVPESILNSDAKLSDDELDIVGRHPEWGADVARLANLSSIVVNIILHHHEKYDGTGYPHRLKGDEIPLEAAIVGISDTYDAITTDRPYQPAADQQSALRIIKALVGTHFSPKLFAALETALQNEPVATN